MTYLLLIYYLIKLKIVLFYIIYSHVIITEIYSRVAAKCLYFNNKNNEKKSYQILLIRYNYAFCKLTINFILIPELHYST